jgi:hypothetical protein
MLSVEQGEIIVDLVRKTVRSMHTDHKRLFHRINSIIEAQEAEVPEYFLLPFSSSLRKAIESTRFDASALPVSIASLFNKHQRYRSENLIALGNLAARIREQFNAKPEEAVIAEHAMALLGLYEDLGAYPVAHWAAFLQDGTCVDGDEPRDMMPFAKEWSEEVYLGDSDWRKPKPVLMIALLARHVGDPATNPDPPVWHHLGLAVLLWKDRVDANQVLEIGSRLSQKQNVEKGLVIAAQIFPEISSWLNSADLEMPKWERRFAIPIAARRLVVGERG